MAGGNDGQGRSLAVTPTWAIAVVCAVLVLISFAAERVIHRLGVYLKKTKQKAWREALERMKDELMLLGFISLAITVSQNYIVKICMHKNVLFRWTPCSLDHPGSGQTCRAVAKAPSSYVSHPSKELLEYGWSELTHWRMLAAADSESTYDPCQGSCRKGHQPLISAEGIHQLHIFVFVLAFVHVFFSAVTMVLSMLKIHSWKKWEAEAISRDDDSRTLGPEGTVGPGETPKTLNRQSTFVRLHTSRPWNNNPVSVWIICFFRQFFRSIRRTDYIALRLGFLMNHNFDKKFNFHSYIVRTLEDESKEIVGISSYLWALVVCFLLFNVHGTNFYFWIALIPPVMLLLIGAKLQHVIKTLALENAAIQDLPLSRKLKPRDELFWLKSPELLLGLIHFVLFQNSFEFATFFWAWWQFGISSCFLANKKFTIIRLCIGFLVQIGSSYSTLPVYALVSQMGSNYKLGGNVKGALQGWANRVKKKLHTAKAAGRQEEDQSTSLQPIIPSRQGESTSSDAQLHRPEISEVRSDQDNEGQRADVGQASTIRITLNQIRL